MAIQDFTPEAEAAITRCAGEYEVRLIAEARGIEQLQNPSGANKQITPAHVDDANLRLRKYYLAPKVKTPPSVYVLAMITVVCSFVGGLASNNWSHGWGQSLFIAMLVIGMICAVLAINKERK